MPQVYQYELELKVRNKTTGTERLVTRVEWAYKVDDVLYQAAINMSKELKTDETLVSTERISPPSHLIEAAALDMTRLIEEAMKRIRELKK